MFQQIERLASPTGASIALHHQPATTSARGILIVSHGLADHARRYRRFAAEMARHGFEVYAFDHRGHGETTAPDAPLGRFARRDGARIVIDDLMAVRTEALSRHPGLPVILIGHSMGGLIALNAAVSYPPAFAGVAVWNSNFHPGLAGRAAQALLLAERALKGSDVPSQLLPRLTFEAWGRSISGHRTLFDWLSNDPQEVDRYIADPLCGFGASVSLWLDIFELTFRAPALLSRLPAGLPLHLVGGSDDPATDSGRAITWLADRARSAGLSDITCKIWPGIRHETLNDTVRDQATQEFAVWASRAATARP
ncbi:MAG: alpha/beta hydrolase [Neorhizobium sp.]|nr:alpha/beta hydrolase [Neorhizobium sp.]